MAISDIPPGWDERLSNLSTRFPQFEQATILAALKFTEGHVGQAVNKLKDCKDNNQGAFVAKLEAGWPEAAPAKKEQTLEPSGGKKHVPKRKLGKDQMQVTVVGGQDPGMTFADAGKEVSVKSVERGGPAAKKGVGTFLFFVVEVAGVKVSTCAELKSAVKSVKAGEKFDFIVGRRYESTDPLHDGRDEPESLASIPKRSTIKQQSPPDAGNEELANTKRFFEGLHPSEKFAFPQHLREHGLLLASKAQGGSGSGGGMVWETHAAFYNSADAMVTCLSFNGSESAGSGDSNWITKGPMKPADVPKLVPGTSLEWGCVAGAGKRILGW